MNMELSAKDKKLLVYLIAVLIIAAAYFFGARLFLDKFNANVTEKQTLESELKSLQSINDKQNDYRTRIEAENARILEAMDKFPPGLSQENTIMMIKDLEDNTGVWITRVSFSGEQDLSGNSETSSEGEDMVAEASEELSNGNVTAEAAEISISPENITNVSESLSLDFYCSYDDFKKFLTYVQNYSSRLTIDSISASYSVEADEVSGSLVLVQYSIKGTGKDLEAPDLSDVKTGTDNIFTNLESGNTQVNKGLELESLENNGTLEENPENTGEGAVDAPTDASENEGGQPANGNQENAQPVDNQSQDNNNSTGPKKAGVGII